MSYDTTRSRLADAFITAAHTLEYGRILCLPVMDLEYAFPVPDSAHGTSLDVFKGHIPNAAFGFKYRADSTGKNLLIEHIVSDGVRRWIDPADAALYRKIGDAYFPVNSRFGMIEV